MKTTRWLAAGMGLLFLGCIAYPSCHHALRGENDFVSFYAGAALIGRGELYSPDVNRRFEGTMLGFPAYPSLYYIRPPFHATLLRPLAWLPYRSAYFVFQGLSLAALFWFIWRFAKEMPGLPVLCAWSIPVSANVVIGQDMFLVIAAAAGAVLLRRAGRSFVAGLLLSLCAAKFHLFLLVPVALLFRREWRMLGGGATGAVALTVVSFVSAGWRWPLEYAQILANRSLNESTVYSVNLRALVFSAIGQDGFPMILGFCLPVLAAALYALWRAKGLETSIAIALLAGLLLSYHAFSYDASLLLLVLVLLVLGGASAAVRRMTALALLPPLYILTSLGTPAVALCLLGLSGLLAFGTVPERPGAVIRGLRFARGPMRPIEGSL